MLPKRVENAEEADLLSIERRLGAGEPLILQFNAPTYTRELLRKVDSFCSEFRDQLTVRFYGHYGTSFDCRTLESVPNVTSLDVDCLQRADNIQSLAELPSLNRISIGIFELEDNEILRFANLSAVRFLSIGDTRTKAVELSFLGEYSNLECLRISGHTRGLEAVAKAPSLNSLALNCIGKKTRLGFVSRVPNLRALSLLLGGRSSIAEIELRQLQDLEIVRVQGLSDLGEISRFPELTSFAIEDQIRIENLSFSPCCSKLNSVRIFNCKSLRTISGLKNLTQLEHLRIGRTSMTVDALLALELPPSLKTCGIYTGKERENQRIREVLGSRGYQEFSSAPERSPTPHCTSRNGVKAKEKIMVEGLLGAPKQ
jgi:hypothetical protein